MAPAQANRPTVLSPTAMRPGLFASRRATRCTACGREVGLLEARHLVDGAAFHTVCVPSSVRAAGAR